MGVREDSLLLSLKREVWITQKCLIVANEENEFDKRARY